MLYRLLIGLFGFSILEIWKASLLDIFVVILLLSVVFGKLTDSLKINYIKKI